MRIQQSKNGFTLIEILIVVAIIGLLVAFTAQPLLSFYQNIRFQGAVENVLAMMDEARKSTLSSYKSSSYGVHIEPTRVVLFRGDMFTEPNPDNDEYEFGSNITIASSSIQGGGDDIIFDRITGETLQTGTIEMTLFTTSTTSRIITIHQSGLVEVD